MKRNKRIFDSREYCPICNSHMHNYYIAKPHNFYKFRFGIDLPTTNRELKSFTCDRKTHKISIVIDQWWYKPKPVNDWIFQPIQVVVNNRTLQPIQPIQKNLPLKRMSQIYLLSFFFGEIGVVNYINDDNTYSSKLYKTTEIQSRYTAIGDFEPIFPTTKKHLEKTIKEYDYLKKYI